MPQTVREPRSWTATTVDSSESWYYRLSSNCLDRLHGELQQFGTEPRPVTDLRLSAAERRACRRDLAEVGHALENGRGFAILEGIPPSDSPRQGQALYWLVGQALGEPVEQNVQGALLYDVRDTGQSLSEGARFSVTNYESSYHTDNSFGDTIADYVGLLCLQVARSGGINHVVSGFAVHRELRDRYPEALATLCRPFHVDCRGGTRPGEPPTVQYPVIEVGPRGPVFRYLRYWIKAGHQKPAFRSHWPREARWIRSTKRSAAPTCVWSLP
jgi:hypothetical protein